MDKPDTAEKPGLTAWQRFVGAILGPRAVFEDVIKHPRFWGGALISLGVTLGLNVLTIPRLQAFVRHQIADTHLPPDQAAMLLQGAIIGAVFVPLIGLFAIWLVYAFLLKAVNLFSGERVPFETFYAIAVFAYVPTLVGEAVRTVLRWVVPVEKFAFVNTSLAFFLPAPADPQHPGLLYLVLSRIDPFTLWTLALLTLGGSLAMKTKGRTVAAGVFSGWVLYVMGYVVLVLLSGPS
ncbi:MAG: YIP1 family protein [Bacillota bacterium]